QKKARISYKEAISIAIQVGMGIEAAHNNQIIHRDIKPQNIIISRDGKVKVTDFGIAKATTSDTISSNVMGSVHYTSPEQARGGYSDQKSDVYSLGITLFEMLTGRVPFLGETTVAIAIKHIQEDLPYPSNFAPDIPVAAEQIVLKCCHKSPDARYQSMGKLIADLKQALSTPDENFVDTTDPEMAMPTRMVTGDDLTQINQPIKSKKTYNTEEMPHYEEEVEANEYMGESDDLYAAYADDEIYEDEQAEYESDIPDEYDESDMSDEYDESDMPDEYDEYDYVENPKIEKLIVLLAIVVGLVIIGTLVFLFLRFRDQLESADTPQHAPTATEQEESTTQTIATQSTEDNSALVSIPSVVDWPYEEAYNTLTNLGFLVSKTERYSELVQATRVINQTPKGGVNVEPGASLELTVSLGPEIKQVEVPDLRGLTEQEGRDALRIAGLDMGVVNTSYSNEYETGKIFYQSFSVNSRLPEGSSVDVTISMGASGQTFRYEGAIEAPTMGEAPDYVSGTPVGVKFIADDGTVLKDATISLFPEPFYIYGMNASGGTITLVYQATLPATSIVNNEGELVTVPGEVVDKTIQRRVEFTPEG
ncbi:MAG: protein kinase, partial [Clostridium sp.]|nr:protein kinase [Clostridium sp.]